MLSLLMRFFTKRDKPATTSQTPPHDDDPETPTPQAAGDAIVTRPATWLTPHPSDVTAAMATLHARATRHALPPWLCENLAALARAGGHAIVKEAIMCEPHSVALIADSYDPARWTDADMQPGVAHGVRQNSALSRRLARLLTAAAAAVAFAEHADDRSYIVPRRRTTADRAPHAAGKVLDDGVIDHIITPDVNPALISKPDPMLADALHDLLSLAVSPRAARNIVAAARASVITTERGPAQYGDLRRVLTCAYDAHCVVEAPARFAVTAAWLCYSAVRDGVLCAADTEPDIDTGKPDVDAEKPTADAAYIYSCEDGARAGGDESDFVWHIIRKRQILSESEITLAMRISTSLAATITSTGGPRPDERIVPAGVHVGPDVDARRPAYDAHIHPPPAIAWRNAVRPRRVGDDDDATDTRGWVGPISVPDDVERMAHDLCEGRRPALRVPADGEATACFALSYKHEAATQQGEWRMGRTRTAALTALATTLARTLARPLWLWVDRVYELDVRAAGVTAGEGEWPEWRAQSLDVFCRVPAMFVERGLRVDEASLWLWAERLAAMCGWGVFGNWLPLIASTDGGIDSVFHRIAHEGPPVVGLRARRAAAAAAVDGEGSDGGGVADVEVRRRVARLMLRANVNTKAVRDRRDFAAMVRWACAIAEGGGRRGDAKEYGTEQDWMGIHVGRDMAWDPRVVERPNVLRIASDNEDGERIFEDAAAAEATETETKPDGGDEIANEGRQYPGCTLHIRGGGPNDKGLAIVNYGEAARAVCGDGFSDGDDNETEDESMFAVFADARVLMSDVRGGGCDGLTAKAETMTTTTMQLSCMAPCRSAVAKRLCTPLTDTRRHNGGGGKHDDVNVHVEPRDVHFGTGAQ